MFKDTTNTGISLFFHVLLHLLPHLTWMLVSCSQFDVAAVIRGPTREYLEMNYSQGLTQGDGRMVG